MQTPKGSIGLGAPKGSQDKSDEMIKGIGKDFKYRYSATQKSVYFFFARLLNIIIRANNHSEFKL